MSQGQANPADVITELLTDSNGVGLLASTIDPPRLLLTAGNLDAQADLTGASALIDNQDSLSSVLDTANVMFDGFERFNPATQQIEIGMYSHGAVPVNYTTINNSDLTERPKFSSPGWTNVSTQAVVNFNDRAYAYQQVSEKAVDPSAYSVVGQVRSISLDRPWITRRNQAVAHAAETLRTIGKPQMKCDLSIRREKGRNNRGNNATPKRNTPAELIINAT